MKNNILTSIPEFTIRFAIRSDVSLILQFIRNLAAYEKLEQEVEATEENLERYLFGENSKAEVIFGEYEKEEVAFALFFYNFSTFLGKPGLYLEDLFVKPQHRGKGYGKKMLSFLAKTAEERNCGRLEWSVLDWNEPAIGFYEDLGAVPMDEWTVYRLTGLSLERLANDFNDKFDRQNLR